MKVYDPNGNMHLEVSFCKLFWVQKTLLLPGSFGKSSIERLNPVIKKNVSIMNSCFIQYNASPEKHVNVINISKNIMVSPRVFDTLSKWDRLHGLWGTKCFALGTRRFSSWLLKFLYTYLLQKLVSILSNNFSIGISFFIVWLILSLSYSWVSF